MPDFSDILLTVDFDRTLTAPDASIPQRNLDAIRYFMDNGGAFTINTGRSLAMYNKYRQIVPSNVPLLLFNGSAAYDTEQEEFTFCHTIDMDMAQAVRICLEKFPDMTVEIQGTDAHYAFRVDPMWAAYNHGNACWACYALGTLRTRRTFWAYRKTKVKVETVLQRSGDFCRRIEGEVSGCCDVVRDGVPFMLKLQHGPDDPV